MTSALPPMPDVPAPAPVRPRKVAIIHYWLVVMRGGERVLERICDLYPDADIFTHVVDHSALSQTIKRHRIFTTAIAKLPFARRQYQKYLPLMPGALEALDLSAYDLVISCEAGPAKGVITRPDAIHVTYCHSPMRYLWDQYHAYRAASGRLAGLYLKLIAPRMRAWDRSSASRPDLIIANASLSGVASANSGGVMPASSIRQSMSTCSNERTMSATSASGSANSFPISALI